MRIHLLLFWLCVLLFPFFMLGQAQISVVGRSAMRIPECARILYYPVQSNGLPCAEAEGMGPWVVYIATDSVVSSTKQVLRFLEGFYVADASGDRLLLVRYESDVTESVNGTVKERFKSNALCVGWINKDDAIWSVGSAIFRNGQKAYAYITNGLTDSAREAIPVFSRRDLAASSRIGEIPAEFDRYFIAAVTSSSLLLCRYAVLLSSGSDVKAQVVGWVRSGSPVYVSASSLCALPATDNAGYRNDHKINALAFQRDSAAIRYQRGQSPDSIAWDRDVFTDTVTGRTGFLLYGSMGSTAGVVRGIGVSMATDTCCHACLVQVQRVDSAVRAVQDQRYRLHHTNVVLVADAAALSGTSSATLEALYKALCPDSGSFRMALAVYGGTEIRHKKTKKVSSPAYNPSFFALTEDTAAWQAALKEALKAPANWEGYRYAEDILLQAAGNFRGHEDENNVLVWVGGVEDPVMTDSAASRIAARLRQGYAHFAVWQAPVPEKYRSRHEKATALARKIAELSVDWEGMWHFPAIDTVLGGVETSRYTTNYIYRDLRRTMDPAEQMIAHVAAMCDSVYQVSLNRLKDLRAYEDRQHYVLDSLNALPGMIQGAVDSDPALLCRIRAHAVSLAIPAYYPLIRYGSDTVKLFDWYALVTEIELSRIISFMDNVALAHGKASDEVRMTLVQNWIDLLQMKSSYTLSESKLADFSILQARQFLAGGLPPGELVAAKIGDAANFSEIKSARKLPDLTMFQYTQNLAVSQYKLEELQNNHANRFQLGGTVFLLIPFSYLP